MTRIIYEIELRNHDVLFFELENVESARVFIIIIIIIVTERRVQYSTFSNVSTIWSIGGDDGDGDGGGTSMVIYVDAGVINPFAPLGVWSSLRL